LLAYLDKKETKTFHPNKVGKNFLLKQKIKFSQRARSIMEVLRSLCARSMMNKLIFLYRVKPGVHTTLVKD